MLKVRKTKNRHIVQGVLTERRSFMRWFFDTVLFEKPRSYRLVKNKDGDYRSIDGEPEAGSYDACLYLDDGCLKFQFEKWY